MYYIFDNTDYVRIECYNLSNFSTYKTLYLYGHVKFEPKDQDNYHENWNNEIIIENIGERMDIEFEVYNNENINSQLDIISLINCINLVKAQTHRFIIYPSYVSETALSTLDKFDCIVRGYYKVKNLVESVSSGNSFTIKFQEYSVTKTFIPKIPDIGNGNVIPFTASGRVS